MKPPISVCTVARSHGCAQLSDWCWWYFCLRVPFVSQQPLVNSKLTSLERGLVAGFLGLGACALVLLLLLAVWVS